jgi:hypothetical protein
MMRKRFLAVLALIVIAVQLGFAAVATRPSLSVRLGGSFCHPTADYLKEYPGNPNIEMPKFRTSRLLSLDLEFLNLAFTLGPDKESAIQVGFGVSYLNVSKSIAYGRSILKPYNGFGAMANLTWRINRSFDLSFRYRFFQCFFSESSARFIAHEFELSPYYRFADLDSVKLFVGTPVSLFWKADSVSVNAAVCFLVSVDSLKIRGTK